MIAAHELEASMSGISQTLKAKIDIILHSAALQSSSLSWFLFTFVLTNRLQQLSRLAN